MNELRRKSRRAENTPAAQGAVEVAPALVRCQECEPLRQQLAAARTELNQKTEELVRERELVNALRLGFPQTAEPAYLACASNGAPLRYVVVDQVNERVKQLLGPIHGRTKQTVGKLLNALQKAPSR